VDRVAVRFDRTIGAKIGRDADHLEDIEFRPQTLAMNEPIPMFTGDKIITFPGDNTRGARIYIRHNEPLPCFVSSIIARGVTNG
jgi:hypothetical protein